MKHVFMGSVYTENYYLGYRDNSYWEIHEKYTSYWESDKANKEKRKEMLGKGLYDFVKVDPFEIRHNEQGEILKKAAFNNHEVISESHYLLRELNVGESVYIDGSEYSIKRKSYGLNEEVIYFTNSQRHEKDEESLRQANENFEKRKEFLKGKQDTLQEDYLTEDYSTLMPKKGFWETFWNNGND